MILPGHSLATCSLAPKCQGVAQSRSDTCLCQVTQGPARGSVHRLSWCLFLPLEKHQACLPSSASQSSLPLGPSAELPDVRGLICWYLMRCTVMSMETGITANLFCSFRVSIKIQ